MNANKQKPLLAAAVVLIFSLLVIVSCASRTEQSIEVTERRWEYTIRVKYEDSDYVYTYDPIKQEFGYRWETETFTRCETKKVGHNLPYVKPEPPCAVQGGDWVEHNLIFLVSYREAESEKSYISIIDLNDWATLEPGSIVRVLIQNRFGNRKIVEVIRKK